MEQSLIETTPCSLCNGLREHLHELVLDINTIIMVWVPCECVLTKEVILINDD